MTDSPAGSQTEILDADECWRYLRSSYIGRLAVINGDVPEIFPVNFSVAGETLVFRTAPGTKLRALLQGTVAALEVDGLNPYATEVWSVVAKGWAQPFEETTMRLPDDADREPWEPGIKDHLVVLTPTDITGRRFAIRSRTRWWPPLDFSADWL
ncbi:pyridoxamine 5'-phosphate oxidase family protein [Pseudarthrobacter sp. BRE9]|uniref:pyridoxamine 5'-phosphate oxidase family protein n=1 Tax=Pseudarthrobacter sp. BRE9 TaxID=2962582 RepID=UPI0028817845|nr:pyridoxamine 5'-phosphate oxidase family protein [Pseudarthrobacter sp. BRE9]MDT0167602.1 pyridoxamine 5'-phosphate oxidase family protein [Pseudarthrobacter sp. BRE9]